MPKAFIRKSKENQTEEDVSVFWNQKVLPLLYFDTISHMKQEQVIQKYQIDVILLL